VRLRQELLLVWWRIGDEGAAVAVARGDKARCRILAEQRETLGVQAVADRQGAAGVGAVLGVGKRGIGAKAGAGQVDAIADPETRDRAGETRGVKFESTGSTFGEGGDLGAGPTVFEGRGAGNRALPVPVTSPLRVRLPPLACRLPEFLTALLTTRPPAPVASSTPLLMIILLPVSITSAFAPFASMMPSLTKLIWPWPISRAPVSTKFAGHFTLHAVGSLAAAAPQPRKRFNMKIASASAG
jgi:hypothetical protein